MSAVDENAGGQARADRPGLVIDHKHENIAGLLRLDLYVYQLGSPLETG